MNDLELAFCVVCVLYRVFLFLSYCGVDHNWIWLLILFYLCSGEDCRHMMLNSDTAPFHEISNLRNFWQIVFGPIGGKPNFLQHAAKHVFSANLLLHCLAFEKRSIFVIEFVFFHVWCGICFVKKIYSCKIQSCF